MKKKLMTLVLAMIMAVSLAANVTSAGAAEAETSSEPLWFAFCSSLTVENADYGTEQLAGIELAVEQINAAGGVNGRELKFDVFDDQGNANEAINCAQKIVSDGKYEFVIGYNSSGRLMASNPTLMNAGMPVFCIGGTAAKVTEQGYDNVIRICPRDDVAVGVVVKAAVENGMEKCVVICDNAEGEISWYEGSVPYFEEYGIEVLDMQKIEVSERDYSSVITNWLKLDIDTIYMSQNYDHLAVFLNQAVDLGLVKEDTLLVSPNGSVNVPQFFNLVSNDVTDGMLIQSCVSVQDPTEESWIKFNEDYTAKTGTKAGEPSVNAYAGLMAVADAYEAGAASENLIETVKGMEFDSILGKMYFDEKGDNIGCPGGVFQVKDGTSDVYQWK